MKDRRRSRRRAMPFVRSAVLQIEGRSHIVAVTDLGPEGAFLSTRIEAPLDVPMLLKLVIPRDGREVMLPCHLIRRSGSFDLVNGRPAGLAVKFQGLSAASIRRIEEFAAEGFLPDPEPTPADHYEYRVVDRSEVDTGELNKLGVDGWKLATGIPHGDGVRLVFVRRL